MSRGGQAGRGDGGERGARRSGEGCPMGSPAGRQTRWGKAGAPERGGMPNGVPGGSQTRWGKAGAPERGGLPGVERRVSTSQAEAAPAVTVGQHDWGGGPLLWAQKCPS